MIATKLKEQFEKNKCISLADLSQSLSQDPMILKDILRKWEVKGRVRQLRKTSACGTKCQQCDVNVTILYEYVI